MKKIINGKMYDTNTAQCIGEDWNGKTGYDFFCEKLYRKKTGEYFLHREGGALTIMARPCPVNSITGSETIIPYTEQEAKKWVERHMDQEDYISLWGQPEE